ncbi:unnamed protein product [Anisakis simplex]|uniref:Fibronectin type-III domain-containing protein n=1 Tax=Anisakis simplex TaxID=6269 RepID=A0A0M3JA17_ANISI|nr:unnamed protein product [Anisakis simplex]
MKERFQNETTFSTVLPMNLKENEEYRVTIFVLNDQLCNSDEVTVPFFTVPNEQFTDKGAFKWNNASTSVNTELSPSKERSENSSNKTSVHGESVPRNSLNVTEPDEDVMPNVDIDGKDGNQMSEGSSFSTLRPTVVSLRTPLLIILVGSATLSALLMTCCVIALAVRNCYKRSTKSEIEKSSIIPWAMAHSSHSMLETNILYRRPTGPSVYIDYEIPSSRIQVGGVIGQGQPNSMFGFAFRCVYLFTSY